ncbi:MAG: hypothetical protein V4858_04340 [Pseudomonadota bacterium]
MFGFGKKPDHFAELMEHLVERSGMRTRFASAFLSEYKDDVSKRFEEGAKRTQQTLATLSRAQQLMFNPSDIYDFAIVGQAYMAYMQDLRRGRHVGTDIERAIWALLVNHSDLLEQSDKALATYVQQRHEEQFPNLLEAVYS